jgi:serine/threonine protein phosphatase PrpC
MPHTLPHAFPHLVTAEVTDRGLHRARNEDAIIRLPGSGVFCVADGIGGSQGGHEASAITVQALLDVFSRADLDQSSNNFDIRKRLVREAMNQACQSIRRHCLTAGYRESGTTAVTMLFDREDVTRAAILHAGDSRAYRYRDGRLCRLTRDHTLAVEAGWPEQDAWVFGMRTIVTRAVGVRPAVDLDETPVDVVPGDVFLLCTDGLTRMLHDRLIADIMLRHGIHDLESTAQALVAQANKAGGKDNITVLLVRVDEAANVAEAGGVSGWRTRCAGWLRRIPWLGRKLYPPTGPALG